MQPLPVTTAKYPVLNAEGKLGPSQRLLVDHMFKRDWLMQIIVFGTLFGAWENIGLAEQIINPKPARSCMASFPLMMSVFSPEHGWPTGLKSTRDTFKGILFVAILLTMGFREMSSSHCELIKMCYFIWMSYSCL